MALVYLSLGSNLGNPADNLKLAVQKLAFDAGEVLKISSFYETEPWGFSSENRFVNAVLLLETSLSPLQLLAVTQEIELKLGRTEKTTTEYHDRLIDIDILLYDQLLIDLPQLKIPHPLMTERDFVTRPLLEIAPEIVHPVSQIKIKDMIH